MHFEGSLSIPSLFHCEYSSNLRTYQTNGTLLICSAKVAFSIHTVRFPRSPIPSPPHPALTLPHCSPSTKWQKAAEIPGAVCEGRVPDLVEGMQYKFRVRAVNKAGPGTPSGESKTMTAKARFGASYMAWIQLGRVLHSTCPCRMGG